MDEAYEKWKKGVYPGHHLWGFLAMRNDSDIEMIILRHEKYKFLNRIGNLIGIGKLDQQIRAVWLLRKCDMIYSPYAASNTKLIIFLKWLGIIRKPVVIVVHQRLLKNDHKSPFVRSFIKKLILKYDSIIFLSENLKQQLKQNLNIPEKVVKEKYFDFNWGPDEYFYDKYSKPKMAKDTNCIISAGHTGRDFETIIEAFRTIDFTLKIYCTPDSVPKTKDIPDNVIIDADPKVTYKDLVKEFEDGRFFLIPLKGNFTGTTGLTSLFDNLAMGKPVIMSKNPYIDLDIEKEGIGLYVKQGDVEDWRRAITSLLHNYDLIDEMGRKSLVIMKERFNLDLYSEELKKVFLKTQEMYEEKQHRKKNNGNTTRRIKSVID